MKDKIFAQLLEWLRTDDSPFKRGYTAGRMDTLDALDILEPWQVAYLNNIKRQYILGIAA